MKIYGTIKHDDSTMQNRWLITAQADIAIRLKRIFPRTRVGAPGEIAVDDTPEASRDLEWVLERWPLEISDVDKRLLRRRANIDRRREERVLEVLGGAKSPELARTPSCTPRSAQLQAADLGLTTRGTICTDDVGGGKSITSLMLLRAADTLPALVVTQTHLTAQWSEEEIPKAWPELTVHKLKKGTPYQITDNGRDPDIIVTNYAKLRGWGDHLAGKIRTVIFDEVQELRRHESAKYEAANHIASRAKYRFGISATPVYNYGDEIFNIMQVLSPGAFGSRVEFAREWCSGNLHRVREPRALGTWMRDQGLMIGRTLEEMGIALPHRHVVVPHLIDTDQREYDRMTEDVIDLARLIATSQAPKSEVWQASGDFSWRMRQATGLAKAHTVAQFTRMIVETHGPVVLFGWHHAVYERWLELLADLNPVLYTGQESDVQKRRSQLAFMNGESNVLIMSLRSGSGLNGLTDVSDRVVFGELDWSPAIHEQCIGRLQRPGQTEKVIAYFLHSNVGCDPMMIDVLDVKRQQAEPIVRPDQKLFVPVADTSGRVRDLAFEFLRSRGVPAPEPDQEMRRTGELGEDLPAGEGQLNAGVASPPRAAAHSRPERSDCGHEI